MRRMKVTLFLNWIFAMVCLVLLGIVFQMMPSQVIGAAAFVSVLFIVVTRLVITAELEREKRQADSDIEEAIEDAEFCSINMVAATDDDPNPKKIFDREEFFRQRTCTICGDTYTLAWFKNKLLYSSWMETICSPNCFFKEPGKTEEECSKEVNIDPIVGDVEAPSDEMTYQEAFLELMTDFIEQKKTIIMWKDPHKGKITIRVDSDSTSGDNFENLIEVVVDKYFNVPVLEETPN